MAAQKLLRESNVLEKEFVTADFVLEKRKSMLRCSTGSKSLDELLLGGLETQARYGILWRIRFRQITDLSYFMCYGI